MAKYNVIVCDPPWDFGDKLRSMKSPTKRSAISQYSTLTSTEVAALDVNSIVDKSGCVLALWVPSTLLDDGLNVLRSWGFTYKQMVVWVKTKKGAIDKIQSGDINDLNDTTSFGMGRLFRQCHEIALIGTTGKVYSSLENKSQRSVLFDLNARHSQKPELLQDRLELMFPKANKLEIFGRRPRKNWTVIGDGVTEKDVTISLQELVVL